MRRFEEEILKAIEQGSFPAASLLVAKKGEVLYRNTLGHAALLPEKEPATEGTLFDIASLTKPVAATPLALLARKEGKITLDTTITRKIPQFVSEEKERITARHLLKHTSGLPAWRPYYEEIRSVCPDLWGKRECRSVYLEKISQESLEVPIAYQRIYSDLGFMLLGFFLEEAMGGTIDQLFQEKIAGPLSLSNTFYIPNDHPPESRSPFAATENSPVRGRILRGEVDDENAYALGGVAGHAGLFSTAEDLHRFLSEWEKGFRNESPIFPQDLVQDFTGPKAKFKLGWDTPSSPESQAGKYFSRNAIGHLGFTGCSFWVDLEQEFHVILLTNRVHPSAENEAIKLFRPMIHDLIYEEIIRS